MTAEVSSGSGLSECKAVVVSKLSAPVLVKFEPVGRWYESRDSHRRLLSGSSGVSGEGVTGVGSEGEEEGDVINPLLLDPTQWKEQDHYVILGLGKLRYKASKDDIRKACEKLKYTGIY